LLRAPAQTPLLLTLSSTLCIGPMLGSRDNDTQPALDGGGFPVHDKHRLTAQKKYPAIFLLSFGKRRRQQATVVLDDSVLRVPVVAALPSQKSESLTVALHARIVP
jgi:hypothetical protein